MIRDGRTLAGRDLLGGSMRRFLLALVAAGAVVLGSGTAAHAVVKQDCYHNAGELPFDFCHRMGWGGYIERMMLVNYLIANRDRHGANIEVLRAQDGSVRLTPLFDNGLSLIFSCYGDEERAARFDPLADVNANNFIGTRSLETNLGLFNVQPAVRPLVETDRTKILHGLDGVLPPTHLNKIWQMIWERWLHYESLRNR